MTKVDFKDYCIMALKDSTSLCEFVEKSFIEELVETIMEKKINNNQDITKDFEMLKEKYCVTEMNILLLANIVYNLYGYYFSKERCKPF